MPDFKGFQGREFREGQFRDAGGTPPGGSGTPPRRPRPDVNVKKILQRVVIAVLVLVLYATKPLRQKRKEAKAAAK